MIMYGVYDSDTLTELIDTVHRMHNATSWRKRTFAGKIKQWLELYLNQEGIPIPILDRNEQAQSYTQSKINKPYIVLNTEAYITL